MQTYTHLAIGAFFGSALLSHQPLMELAVTAGAIAPDLVMVPYFILDKMAGREPLEKKPLLLKILLLPSHSIPLWALLALAGYLWFPLLCAFGIGGLVFHVVIDIFSHGNPKLNYEDSPYWWPFPGTIHIGTWDYRIKNGSLWPLKPVEFYILVFFSVAAAICFLFQWL